MYNYRIESESNALIKSQLTDRNNYIIFNNIHSDMYISLISVPRVSILGPLLFCIICKLLSFYVNYLVYANYTTLYSSFDNFSNPSRELEINQGL